MKFVVAVVACVLAVANAQFQYNKASAYSSGFQNFPKPSGFRSQPPKPFKSLTVTRPEPVAVPVPRPVVANAKYNPSGVPTYSGANILKFGNEIQPDGAYSYFFETDNGIAAQAQGTPRNFGGNPPVVPDVAQGSFSWTSPEGVPIAISYVADENGYQPQGDAIPTPPPVPPQIARALEYIARSAPRK